MSGVLQRNPLTLDGCEWGVADVVLSTFASEIRYPVRLSTERTPANTNRCFRN